MDVRRLVRTTVVVIIAAGLAAIPGDAATASKKTKGQRAQVAGAAGAVSSTRGTFKPLEIIGDAAQGVYCTSITPNVHHLGTLPPNVAVILDFESDDTSDPIAILTSVKTDGVDVSAEHQTSDDEGGNLNPRFDVRRPYRATYILTVATADDVEACYAYRMRIIE